MIHSKFVRVVSLGLLALPLLSPLAAAQNPANDRLTLQGAFVRGMNSVFQVGSVYSLKFAGLDETIEYQVDVNNLDVRRGVLRVYEKTSDSFPVTIGGVVFRDLAGNSYLPMFLSQYTTLTNQYTTADSVVLEYQDSVPNNGVHHRRHTFKIEGKALSITVEDIDHNLASAPNYNGMYLGPTQGTESSRIVQMQGSLAAPIVLFRNGAEHFFFGNTIDMFQSNASDWVMNDFASLPVGTSSINATVATSVRYYKNSAGTLSAPLKDTWSIAVSHYLKDVLIAPTQKASPYRELLLGRTFMILAGDATSWSQYQTYFGLLESWGMDDLAAYTFSYWSTSADDPLAYGNQGPDWYPAKDATNFTSLVSSTHAQGTLFGVYTAFSTMPLTAPASVFDPAQIAKTGTGQWKIANLINQPLLAITAAGIHALSEATLLKQHYDVNMFYLDVLTYASPAGGADGSHIDETAGSGWAATLHDAHIAQKSWMSGSRDILEGPQVGEGSIASQASNMEWLHAGYCDSVQRVINTGSGASAHDLPAGDPRSPTKWPVIPEFELRVMNRLQANHGNGYYPWFFSRSDTGMVNPDGSPIYPMTDAMLDRYRIYEITYGHASFFISNGPFPVPGNMLYFPDMIKEYYMMHALQTRYLSAPIKTIQYYYQGTLQSFEAILSQTETTDTFRDPKIRLEYQNGLVIYLNHSTSDWPVTLGGVAYTIPEDGWVAQEPTTGFVEFSAIPPNTGGHRIDYCLAPGEYEFFDGRGTVSAFGNINTGSVRRLKLTNFVHGTTVAETSTGTVQVTAGPVPHVVSVDIVGARVLAIGQRRGLKAIAHYDNGAFRNVTTLVDWTSSNTNAASINSAAALNALAHGRSMITTTNFGGVASTPLWILVQ
jgi:hypothetical protein